MLPTKIKPDNVKVSMAVVVDLPAGKFDLADWIVHFRSEEYIACTPASRAHKQMHVYRGEDGGLVFRNDEVCSGIALTQLYREGVMEPKRVLLVSPRSRGRVFGVWPMAFQVTWEMKVEPFDKDRSKFICTVGLRLNPIYRLGGFLVRLQYWLQSHIEEEAPHFADAAVRWATRNDAEPTAAPAGGA